MSSSENTPVQDLLRKVIRDENPSTGINSGTLIRHICNALGRSPDSITYGDDLRKCLIEIADRIDKQTVVEVTAPPAKPKNAVKLLFKISSGASNMFTFSCYHTAFEVIMPKYCPFCGRPVEEEASDE